MAHQPKPFFRSARDAWYVQIGKSQIKLCPGPKNSATEKAAWEAFHNVMADRPAVLESKSANSAGPLVVAICDKFLDWTQKHRAPRTYDWYLEHIQGFISSLDDRHLPVSALKPFHVTEWADAHPNWGDTFRRGAIIGVQRAFNWAEKQGHIDRSPVKHVEKPQPKRREQAVSPVEFAAIRDHYSPGDPFRDLLEFAWESGARPQEIRVMEARHVDLNKLLVVFPKEEAKGKKRVRLIRLTEAAAAVLKTRVGQFPAGPMFRNRDGNPWTMFSVNCRFTRLKKHLGTKYGQYSIRHGFATRLLEGGNDHLTVAELLGHADGTMPAKTYQHLNERDDHLRDALNKGK